MQYFTHNASGLDRHSLQSAVLITALDTGTEMVEDPVSNEGLTSDRQIGDTPVIGLVGPVGGEHAERSLSWF